MLVGRLTTQATIAAAAIAVAGVGPAVAQEVTGEIEYGYWANAKRAEVTEAVSRAFEAANPGASVTGLATDYYAHIERLRVQSAARDLPCIPQMQSLFLATFASRGALMPLDDLIAEGAIDTSGIPEAMLDNGKYDGQQYMIPTGAFLRLVAVNDTMREEYGIAAPPENWDFEAYKDWVITAQESLPEGIYAAENEAPRMFTLYSWFAGHGEQFFVDGQINDDGTLLAGWFSYWEEMREAGAVPSADRIDELFFATELSPLAVGSVLSGTRDIPHALIIEDVRAAQGEPSDIVFHSNPKMEGVTSGNVPGTNGLTISRNCENVDTAAAYIDFFSNDPEAAVLFESANGVVISEPARDALLESPDTPESVMRSLQTMATYTDAGDIASANYPSGYQGLEALLRRQYEEIAFNGKTPEEAAEAFLSEASSIIR